jgi:hypothetical protein
MWFTSFSQVYAYAIQTFYSPSFALVEYDLEEILNNFMRIFISWHKCVHIYFMMSVRAVCLLFHF